MFLKLDIGPIEQIGDIQANIQLVEAHVKVWMIEEVKSCIDHGEIEQNKLLDESSYDMLILILNKLICIAWDELEIDISSAMLVANHNMAIHLYRYLRNDFKLLSMNYGVNKNDIYFNPHAKKKILLNTIEVLKEKAKYLEDNEEIKDEYEKTLVDLEYKVDYHGDTRHLTALLLSMENAKVHLLLNVGVNTEKLIYPEILDLFKDYFYLKYAFQSDKKRIDRLKRNLKNNPKTKLTPAEDNLLVQLSIVERGQESSYLRSAYELKYMYEFRELRGMCRQLLKDNVKIYRNFASYKFEEMPYIPLVLFKYTLLYG